MKKIAAVFFVTLFLFSLSHTAVANEAPELNYRLKWLKNMSVVGDLYADDKGYFTGAGLKVKVKSGGPERDAIRELELGSADFGVASADQVIRALSKGAKIVVLAQFFQINPLQWIYRSSLPELKSAADLSGHTIGITYGGNDETVMKALLANGQVAAAQVKFFSVRYDYTPFYQGKAEFWPVYKNAQGPILKNKLAESGESVHFLDPGKMGVKFVANSLVTSKKFYTAHPEVVNTFTQALLRGWKDALLTGNRDTALAIVRTYDKDTDPKLMEEQYDITRGLVQPDKRVVPGKIDNEAWKQTEQIMLDQKLIAKPVNISSVLYPLKSH